jgi:hypothetical protein
VPDKHVHSCLTSMRLKYTVVIRQLLKACGVQGSYALGKVEFTTFGASQSCRVVVDDQHDTKLIASQSLDSNPSKLKYSVLKS